MAQIHGEFIIVIHQVVIEKQNMLKLNVLGRLRCVGPMVSLENNMENEKTLKLLV